MDIIATAIRPAIAKPPPNGYWLGAMAKLCRMVGILTFTSDAGKWVESAVAPDVGQRPLWDKGRARTDLGVYMARKKRVGLTIKEFVEANRAAKSAECIFVPKALRNVPAKVSFCGKTISAARYMALLTFGAPNYQDTVVRHLCGNGHLSCINPAHLEWGAPSDNIADARKHKGCETAQDRIFAVSGKK